MARIGLRAGTCASAQASFRGSSAVWAEHDHRGATILGDAVTFAAHDYDATDYVAVVGRLLDVGAPERDDELTPEPPDVAEFLLAHGQSPDYVAPDARSLRVVLADAESLRAQSYGTDAEARARFLAALEASARTTPDP